MAETKALVITGNGTNCERETAHACRRAGAARVDIVYIWDLLAGDVTLRDYNLLCLPGGFMDGDDLGAAKAGAHRFRYGKTPEGVSLFHELQAFIQGPRLVLGICNGFQLMVKLGLIPNTRALGVGESEPSTPQEATVWANDSGRFEDRWVHLKTDDSSPCVFTTGPYALSSLDLPVRHGEGKVVFSSKQALDCCLEHHLTPLFYANQEGGAPTEAYPQNPNGSPHGIAGLCDPTGRLFGLMPHPEAFTHKTNHPRWTASELPEEGTGLVLFKNALHWLRENG